MRGVAIGLAAALTLLAPGAFATPADAARAALERLGVPRDRVAVTLVRAEDARYRVRVARGRVAVTASSPAAAVRGVTAELRRQGLFYAGWEGRRVGALAALRADDSGWVASPFGYRAYLNTCTYGYTTPWWDWPRWEREIDLMAVRGVDLPLAMEGQEYVWRALWREQGLSDAAIRDHLAGAPFLPWQRMGNMAGYRAPLSDRWIDRKHDLQRRLLARYRDLGMTPILPAFAGYVPEAFARAHPKAKIYRMRQWEGFPGTYWLDPSDPLFAELAADFLRLYAAAYGPGRYYLADAFNEMVPPIADDGSDTAAASYGDSIANTAATRAAALAPAVRDARLAAYGRRLYQSIAAARPGATWVMQGWLFGADKGFWTPEAIAAFLRDVPDRRMLLLDIGNDRYPGIWSATHGFDGKGWIYGYVHNYGGSNPLYGALDFYRRDLAALQADPARGRVSGFGMFPEGLNSDGLVYDYAYDAAWPDRRDAMDVPAWLERYLAARYGAADPAVVAAWRDVVAGLYDTRYWTPRWWHERAGAYLLFKRPGADAPDYPAAPGDRARARAGIAALLARAPAHADSALFRHDIVDLVRHEASIATDAALARAVAAYRAGDVAGGDAATARARALAERIDALIGGQQETLASWIADARGYGASPSERDRYETDAKAQVTIWGGTGHLGDYASKAWAGLYAHYYLPRWTLYLDAARAAAVARHPVDEADVARRLATWEKAWVADHRRYTAAAPADALADARALMTEVER
ncbi:alpha-N-acetylglucosaminidase TIM-barrel domain-containing protein [Sphingomonas yunnanensis]|uniref:alpha-N-acetylglucosaminidase TIM-barrel domain-containing protein n=1 Tax=Sphingomonas yunnanensis TaxID=310400 RepID=UPI0031BAAF88